jgi:hypothetical protein
MNWYKTYKNGSRNSKNEHEVQSVIRYFNEKGLDLASGDCGTFAIALGQYFSNLNPVLVVATNLDENEVLDLNFDGNLYHVAIELNGSLYDYRGKISLQDIAIFVHNTYGDLSCKIDYLYLDNSSIQFIKQNTRWNFDDYYYLSEIEKYFTETETETEIGTETDTGTLTETN